MEILRFKLTINLEDITATESWNQKSIRWGINGKKTNNYAYCYSFISHNDIMRERRAFTTNYRC